MARVRLVVTDLDNTLYSWVNYVVYAIDAMVQSLSDSTGESYEAILDSLKAVYRRRGSIEYPFVIQVAPIFQERLADFEAFSETVLVPARKAFSEERRRRLRPFDTVVPTLERLRELGIPVVGLSDASSFSAALRLRMLGLDGHLDALYAIQPFELPPANRIERRILEKQEAGAYKPESLKIFDLPVAAVKPSLHGFELICAAYGVRPDETLMVGDNLTKDIGMAQAAGALDLWAEYGTWMEPDVRQRLERCVPRSVLQRNAPELKGSSITPRHSLQSFGELLGVAGFEAAGPGSTAGERSPS